MTDDPFDAVVLAGGRARRLDGVPKPTLVVAGRTLLDRALAATDGACRTVVVAPSTALTAHPGVLRTQEDPPFGGPVAGLDAGLRALAAPPGLGQPATSPWVLVLAVDVPHAAGAVPGLRRTTARDGIDGAHLVRDGRDQWLVGLYRHDALRGALDDLADRHGGLHGLPVRRLVSRLAVVRVPDLDDLSVDVDTWDDVRRLTVGDHEGVPTSSPAPTDRGGIR